MQIGFVVTNYNSSNYTNELVNSLNKFNQSLAYPIVIVDNNSDDNNIVELKLLKEKYSNVHVIFNKINHGYFRGLNIGINYIKDTFKDITHLVVGNNDLIFSEGFIVSILNKSELFFKYPVISPNIITLDNEHQNPHVIEKISKFRELVYDIYYSSYFLAKTIKKIAQLTKGFTDRKDEEQHEIAQSIYQGYGACYILGPLFFENFDLLWAPTFLMGEEFFLSKQLESKNFKVYYEPTIVIKHQLHSSMNNVPSKKIWQIARESHKEYRKYVNVWK